MNENPVIIPDPEVGPDITQPDPSLEELLRDLKEEGFPVEPGAASDLEKLSE